MPGREAVSITNWGRGRAGHRSRPQHSHQRDDGARRHRQQVRGIAAGHDDKAMGADAGRARTADAQRRTLRSKRPSKTIITVAAHPFFMYYFKRSRIRLLAMVAGNCLLSANAADYIVTNADGIIAVTDISGNGDTLEVSEPDLDSIQFSAPNRTFSVNGSPNIPGNSGPVSLNRALTGIPKVTQITVSAGSGNDTISVKAFKGILPALTINGGTGDDTVIFMGDLTFAPGASLEVDLLNDNPTPGLDSVTLSENANLIVPGSGSITVKAGSNVNLGKGSSLVATNGNLTVAAKSVTLTGNSRIAAGTITLIADRMSINTVFPGASVEAQPGGSATLHPLTQGVGIDLGSTTDLPAGPLSLSAAELNRISTGPNGSLVIGNGISGNLTVSQPITLNPTNAAMLKLESGGSISDTSSADVDLTATRLGTSGNLSPGAQSGGAVGTFSVAGDYTLSDHSTFSVDIGGTEPGTQHDQVRASGEVEIGDDVALVTRKNNSFKPALGQSFTIISRTGGGGTFAGLPEGAVVTNNFLESGLPAIITYVGGAGHDVILIVPAPEIEVSGNGVTIGNQDKTPSLIDNTDFGSAVRLGTPVVRTFMIANRGRTMLTLGTVSISGLPATEFTVTTQPANSVAPGSSTIFQVTFKPTATGIRSANLTFTNNDTDEGIFKLFIQGKGVSGSTSPEIAVFGNGVNIADGDTIPQIADHTDFGNATVEEGMVVRTFIIVNGGTANLSLNSIPPVTISGSDDFTVTLQPTNQVVPGASTIFQIAFAPKSNTGSIRNAQVNFRNNVSLSNPFNFAIQGKVDTVIAPAITVTGNGHQIATGALAPRPNDDDDRDFGEVSELNGKLTRTFTIVNSGTADLKLGPVSLDGTAATDFYVTTQPSASVPSQRSASFKLTFDPTGIGLRSATVRFTNNVTGTNFTFAIQGTGVGPDMVILGNGLIITNRATQPNPSDATDFGDAIVNGDPVAQTFTITNTSVATLTLRPVVIGDGRSTDFTVTSPPASTVSADQSSTFTITFNPSSQGLRSANVIISNNVSAKNPYTFAIQGMGIPPKFSFATNEIRVNEAAGMATLVVRKSGRTAGKVRYQLGPDAGSDSAKEGRDFALPSSTEVSFAANETQKSIQVTIYNNFQLDSERSFHLELVHPDPPFIVGASNAVARISIDDDDDKGIAVNSFPLTAGPLKGAQNTGVKVTTSPNGGQWRLSWEPFWRASGAAITNLLPSKYEVAFKPLAGFANPPNQEIEVTAGNITNRIYSYLENPALGQLEVRLRNPEEPDKPLPSGRWQLDLDGNARGDGLHPDMIAAGRHLISFNTGEPGFSTPETTEVEVIPGQVAVITGNYLPPGDCLPADVATPASVSVPGLDAAASPQPQLNAVGQLRSVAGFGSGVAVRDKVVLTAAHVVFDDLALAPVPWVSWQAARVRLDRDANAREPQPSHPRGLYLLGGYAAQRAKDTNGSVSPESAHHDAATLWFVNPVAQVAFAGYLVTRPTNDWFKAGRLLQLAGYPIVGGIDCPPLPGRLYRTDAITSAPGTANAMETQVYTFAGFRSYPGNSGGPVFTQNESGSFYPAGIYLGDGGTVVGGGTVSRVRVIDTDVLELINRAASSANAMVNFTGGGVLTFVGSAGNEELSQQSLTVNFYPQAAASLARWKLSDESDDRFRTNGANKFLISPTNVVVTFTRVPGFEIPTNFPVQMKSGQDSILDVTYAPVSVMEPLKLALSPAQGVQVVSGSVGRTLRLQFRVTLDGASPWADVPGKSFTGTSDPQTVLPLDELKTAESSSGSGFYRVVVP